MTEFFSYADLTFREIAALPRDCPLVIPLGQVYPLERLVSALGDPQKIGFLLPMPFGWAGSGLTISESVLGVLLSNLIASLRDEGFINTLVLTPQGLNLGLGSSQIALQHPSQSQPMNPLPPDSERDKVIILPVGHIEQHAYHLPVSTDTLIIDAIGRAITAAIPEKAWVMPCIPYGVSTHRASFAGTLNCGGRAFEDFWLEIIRNLSIRGFERLYLINGHGGNHSFLVNAIKYAGERFPRSFIASSWLYLSGPQGITALNDMRTSPLGGMGHACELETSLILHLHPELVHMENVVDELDFITTPSYYMDWVEGGALIANPPWEDDTLTGAYGAGSQATAEKGEFWLSEAIAEKINHVGEIHEQFTRRRARRACRS